MKMSNLEDYNKLPLDLKEVTDDELRILLKKVGQAPSIEVIKNTLEEKQKIVDGLIEVVPYKDVLIICNEDGKILNQKPNILFDYDYIAGDCFFVGDDYENGDFKSLNQEQITDILYILNNRSLRYTSQDLDEEKER